MCKIQITVQLQKSVMNLLQNVIKKFWTQNPWFTDVDWDRNCTWCNSFGWLRLRVEKSNFQSQPLNKKKLKYREKIKLQIISLKYESVWILHLEVT